LPTSPPNFLPRPRSLPGDVERATAQVVLKQRPTYSSLAGAAKAAPLAGPAKTRVVTVPDKLVRRAELVIDRSGLPGWFDTMLPAQAARPTGGPVRQLTVHALLTGGLLLAMSNRPMVVRDLAALLDGLHPSTKIPAAATPSGHRTDGVPAVQPGRRARRPVPAHP